MKKISKNPDIFSISLLLLILVMVACYSSSGLLARFTSTASGSDTVTVARWDGTVSGDTLENLEIYAGISSYNTDEQPQYGISGSDVTPDAHGYVTSGYGFTVTTTATETSSAVSILITVSQNGNEAWPSGMQAALYSVSGDAYTFIAENDTGVFTDIKLLAPSETFSGNYIVRFKASPATVVGNYDVDIVASLDQVD